MTRPRPQCFRSRLFQQNPPKGVIPKIVAAGTVLRAGYRTAEPAILFFARNLPELAAKLVACVGLRDQIEATLELPPM